jgi:secreted trypsin-like serine protease
MTYYNGRPHRTKPEVEVSDERKHLRISQGAEALSHQFPFAASLTINGIHACGGIVIAPRVVLSAAHCVVTWKDNEFHDLGTMLAQVGGVVRNEGKSYGIVQAIIPEVFDTQSSLFGDIALLELSEHVNISTAILHDTNTTSDMLTVIGWGFTSNTSALSSSLLHTLIERLSDEECDRFHWNSGLGDAPIDHFCAGNMASGADSCQVGITMRDLSICAKCLNLYLYCVMFQGDSGGPILWGDIHVVGLTSYGSYATECGEANSVGVYTRVDYWYPWLNDSMSLYNLNGESRPSRINTPDFNSCWDAKEYNDVIYAVSITDSVGMCVEKCREDKGCSAWEWNFSSKQCRFASEGGRKKVNARNCHTGVIT